MRAGVTVSHEPGACRHGIRPGARHVGPSTIRPTQTSCPIRCWRPGPPLTTAAPRSRSASTGSRERDALDPKHWRRVPTLGMTPEGPGATLNRRLLGLNLEAEVDRPVSLHVVAAPASIEVALNTAITGSRLRGYVPTAHSEMRPGLGVRCSSVILATPAGKPSDRRPTFGVTRRIHHPWASEQVRIRLTLSHGRGFTLLPWHETVC